MGLPYTSAADVMKSIKMPEPPTPPARAIYERLQEWVADEKRKLQSDQELSILCCLPGGTRVALNAFGYVGAQLLMIEGSDDNAQPTKSLIHYSSLCLTLAVTPKEPNKPRREIGFNGGIDEKAQQATQTYTTEE